MKNLKISICPYCDGKLNKNKEKEYPYICSICRKKWSLEQLVAKTRKRGRPRKLA
jgi:uncharacterized protein YbaR (Trm112 family)